MLGKVFKAYDVRATYPKPLSEKLAWQIGYGTAEFLTTAAADAGHDEPMMRHLVVGRDMRKSSPDLCASLVQGIRDYGAHVIDVGLIDTPFIYFAINYLGCCGGVQVTASHNPSNYNGFKISRIGAKPVGAATGLDEIRRLSAIVDRDKIEPANGRYEQRDLWDAYREHVLGFLPKALISGSRRVSVVIDASNGMAGTMIPNVFSEAKGLKIKRLNFDNSTGEFKHEPNPLVEANLEELREQVVKTGAQAGICFDGDADRCIVLDEQGRTIGCDLLTGVLAQRFLAEAPGEAVVYDLRSSHSVPEAIQAAGGRPIRSRVGHVFMKAALARYDAVFGGELSGHFYFRDNFYADSGAVAFASVCALLAESDQPLSRVVEPMRKYAQSGEINFQTEEKEEALDDLRRAYSRGQIDDLDGVTIDLSEREGWWANVRPSNTEPLLRLNLEAMNEEMVEQKVAELSKYLGERVAH